MIKSVSSFILVFIFYSLVMVSCVSKKPAEPVMVEHTKEITKMVKDTIYKVEADSSFYYAYVDCVKGKPVLKEPGKNNQDPNSQNLPNSKLPTSKPGKNLQIPAVKLNGNMLSVGCYQKALELFKTWRETYIKENTVKIQPPKPLKWYQKFWLNTKEFLAWIGVVFIILSAIGIALKFINPLKK